MKHLPTLLVVSVFGIMAALTRHTPWVWPVLAAWLTYGLVWFHIWGRHWTIWWVRRHFRNRLADRVFGVATFVVVTAYSAMWPVWVLAGEDVFD